MLEMKIVLVMVARAFEFGAAYEELDGRERGRRGGSAGVARTVNGVRGYQVGMMQPQGDLPCRVKRVET